MRGPRLGSTRIGHGAVPLGQHNHQPDKVRVRRYSAAVSGLTPHEEEAIRPPLFENLPTPAEPFAGCCRCRRPAILVLPATGEPYCCDCWTEYVVQGQLA